MLIEIINKPLLLHLVGYLYYWQMGFNSVFKGIKVDACISVIGIVVFLFTKQFSLNLYFQSLRPDSVNRYMIMVVGKGKKLH